MKLYYRHTPIERLDGNPAIYLGFNGETKLRLSKSIKLEAFSTVPASFYSEFGNDFSLWASEAAKSFEQPLNFWGSSFGSKAILQTDAPKYVMLANYLKRLLEKEENQSLNVIVDSPLLFKLLEDNFAPLEVYGRSLVQKELRKLKRGYFLRGLFISFAFLLKQARNKFMTTNSVELFSSGNYVLSFCDKRNLSKEVFDDHYVPHVQKSSEKVQYLLPLEVSPDIANSLSKKFTRSNFFSLINLASYTDIFSSALNRLRTVNLPYFNGINLNFIWSMETKRENSFTTICQRALEEKIYLKLGRRTKGSLLYPYEGQPWEKILLAGCNQNKELRTVGVQHCIFGKGMINFIPSPTEPIPSLMLTISQEYDSFFKSFSQKLLTEIVGGLRYGYLLDPIKTNPRKERLTIGVLFPIGEEQCSELWEELKNNSPEEYDFLFRFHPHYKIPYSNLPSNIKEHTGQFTDFLPLVDGVVYCASGVGLESFNQGIPTFKFEGGYFDTFMGEIQFQPNLLKALKELKNAQLTRGNQRNLIPPPDLEKMRSVLLQK